MCWSRTRAVLCLGRVLLACSAQQSGVGTSFHLELLSDTGPEVINAPSEGDNCAHFYGSKRTMHSVGALVKPV